MADDVVRDSHEVIVSLCARLYGKRSAKKWAKKPLRPFMNDRHILTYQTRLALALYQSETLDAYAQLYGCAERNLFAALRAGGEISPLKKSFQKEFGINARQFNAVRVGLEGKIASIRERQPELIAEAEYRIKKAVKTVAALEKRSLGSDKLHQKKRRLEILQMRHAAMKADHDTGKVRLCFGSRKLFRAQFALEANGYVSHAKWKSDWEKARNSQFFVLGSKDETTGNQNCQASVEQDGSLTLKLRLPDAMSSYGKHLFINGIRFAYGHDAIVKALSISTRIQSITKTGRKTTKRTECAISYRFVLDDKSWRIFVSVEATPVECVTECVLGAIGIDINTDHLAIAETDHFGNLIKTHQLDLINYGKTQDQAKARIGDAAVAIVAKAKVAQKPIIIEKLDFRKKKSELEGSNPAKARMISSFSYSRTLSALKAAAFRCGVEIVEVNPAFTSVIGAVNFARVKGISVHQGAALAIARRGLGLSERPTGKLAITPARNGGHVTFSLPVRNRKKHVWSFWSKVRSSLKAAHVAHHRLGLQKGKPTPLPPEMRALGATWFSTAKSRGANRQQYCSADVIADVPF